MRQTLLKEGTWVLIPRLEGSRKDIRNMIGIINGQFRDDDYLVHVFYPNGKYLRTECTLTDEDMQAIPAPRFAKHIELLPFKNDIVEGFIDRRRSGKVVPWVGQPMSLKKFKSDILLLHKMFSDETK